MISYFKIIDSQSDTILWSAILRLGILRVTVSYDSHSLRLGILRVT